MPAINLPKRVLIFAAVALIVCAATINIFLLKPHNDLTGRKTDALPIPNVVKSPVIQLELARSEKDIREILMVGDTAKNISDARAGNHADTYLFIPCYTMLLVVLTVLILRSGPLLYLLLLAICITALCDWAENAGIERTLNHIEQSQQPLAGDALRISHPSIAKWSLVSVILLVLGGFAIGRGTWGMRALGLLLTIQGAAVFVQLVFYFREI